MTAITWSKRARVRRTDTATIRCWLSECGRYKVCEIKHAYGRYYLAARRLAQGEYPISRHKTRAAAERACGEHRR